MTLNKMIVSNPSPRKYTFKFTRLRKIMDIILNLASIRCSRESPAL
jgi:hypothetical protein